MNDPYLYNPYLYDPYLMDYAAGGWLKSNLGNILQTAGGIGAMFIPGGQAAGIGMMASGIGGMATTGDQFAGQQQAALQNRNQQLVVNTLPGHQDYIPTFAGGGTLSPKDFTMSYIQSPKYRERLASSGYNVDDEIRQRLGNVSGLRTYGQYGALSEPQQAKLRSVGRPFNPSSSGGSTFLPGKGIIVDYKQAEKLGASPKGIEAHEFGHGEVGSRLNGNAHTSRLNQYDRDAFLNRLKPTANPVYRTAPDEMKADTNAFKYLLQQQGIYNPGTQDLNQEMLNQSEDSFIKNRLLQNYNPEDLIWLMNNIAMNNGTPTPEVAASGGWIKGAAASVKRRGTQGKCGPGCNRPGCTGRALALCHAFHTIARNRKKHAAGGELTPNYIAAAKKAYPQLAAWGGMFDPIMDRVSSFASGGTHEQSPLGGIPIGQNALVEQGEYMYTTKGGKKYIFSDRF